MSSSASRPLPTALTAMDLIKPEQITSRFRNLAGMPVARQLALMVGLALSVSIGLGVVLWSREPLYRPLYTDLSAGDAGAIIGALQERGVPYRVDQHSGTVLVPAEGMHETRIALASAGLPKSGGVGFELLDSQGAFGESEFMESARYQRVLEGELGRTIASLADVQGVRVHLALPKRSLFLREREKPSASVLLNLFPGRSLEPVQVQAIVHLVSASVANLERGRVTVIDQSGRLLSSGEEPAGLEASMDQLSYARRVEAELVRRVEEILTPILGPGRVRAQVMADIDFTVVESTEEAFGQERQALRSEQVSEQRSKGSALVGGVPGALSNQPPEGGAVEAGGAAGGGSESSNRSSTRNYEVDRTIRHVRSPGSVLRRLSVAVVVDEPLGTDAEGNPRPEPLSEAQLADLTALVKKAVGFTEERGDSVHLVTASFQSSDDAALISDPPLWQQPWLWSLVKQLVGALVVALLALGVLRQLFKAVPAGVGAAPGAVSGQPALTRTVAGTGAGAALAAPDGTAPDRVQLSSDAQAIAGQLVAAGDYERQVARAQSLVQEDPRLAANLVREWIGYER